MAQDQSSVMNSLHKISSQIAEATRRQNPSAPASDPMNSTLSNALLRRYDDLIRTRRDLAARLMKETESLRAKQEITAAAFNRNAEILTAMEQFLATVQQADFDFDPGDQKRLSDECRAIENIRMELIQLQTRTETNLSAGSVPESVRKESAGTHSILPEIASLTFPQIFRLGFAFLLPLVIGLLLLGGMIAAAVILSYNGVFLW